MPDRNNPGKNNFRGYESLRFHKTDTKTASRTLRVPERVMVWELVLGVGDGQEEGEWEGACRIPVVSSPQYPWRDPLRVAEDHRMARDFLVCLCSETFHSQEHRTFSEGCRTCSPSVARLLAGSSRAPDRRVVVGDLRTSEPASHERLHLAVTGLSSSAVHLLACQQDLCKSRKYGFVLVTLRKRAPSTHYTN